MTENKDKKIQITFFATKELQEKLEVVKSEMGFYTRSEALRYAVSFTAKKLAPDYITVQKQRNAVTPEVRAERSVDIQEAREQKAKVKESERQQILIKKLNAKVQENGMVKFTNYKYMNPQTEPWEGELTINPGDLQESHLDRQFRDFPEDMSQEQINKLCNSTK